jgi:hypothetical protein
MVRDKHHLAPSSRQPSPCFKDTTVFGSVARYVTCFDGVQENVGASSERGGDYQ